MADNTYLDDNINYEAIEAEIKKVIAEEIEKLPLERGSLLKRLFFEEGLTPTEVLERFKRAQKAIEGPWYKRIFRIKALKTTPKTALKMALYALYVFFDGYYFDQKIYFLRSAVVYILNWLFY